MHGWMDGCLGWMHGWMDGSLGGWMDGWMDRWFVCLVEFSAVR